VVRIVIIRRNEDMGMKPDQISIRKPTAVFRPKQGAPTFNLDRPIAGLRVGLRNDPFWRSWLQVCELWSQMLRRDGAEPVVLRIGEHVGQEGQHTKESVQSWAESVDCAVVGLAN
jgi:hypothetical protein